MVSQLLRGGRKCGATVKEIRGETFVRLMEVLVGSVLLYGAEVWGGASQLASCPACTSHTSPILPRASGEGSDAAARIFLGVRRLHQLASLQYELNFMLLKREGMRRCIGYWVRVLRMGEDRLHKVVMLEAMEMGSRVRWAQDLECM